MAIEEKTLPYQILIRFGPDGLLQGAAGYQQKMVVDGERLISWSELPAAPLDIVPGGSFWGVLNEAQATALKTADAAIGQIVDLQASNKVLSDQNGAMISQCQIFSDQIAELQGKLAEAGGLNSALTAQGAVMAQQIADLTAAANAGA